MENNYFNQRIACTVTQCKYYNQEEERCTLGQITVKGSSTKEDSYCDNFENEDNE